MSSGQLPMPDVCINLTETDDPALVNAVVTRNPGPPLSRRGIGDVYRLGAISEPPRRSRMAPLDSYYVTCLDQRGREIIIADVACDDTADVLVAAVKSATSIAAKVHPGSPIGDVVRVIHATTTYEAVPISRWCQDESMNQTDTSTRPQ